MGIIQKQTLRSTFVSMVGVAVGAVTRLLMPVVMASAQIGVIALLDAISGVFVVLFNLGYNLILKHVFPKFRNEETGHSGFLMFGILLTLFGSGIGISVYYLFSSFILSNPTDDSSLIHGFAYLIPLIIFFRMFFVNLDGYVRMLFNTVIGAFLEGLVGKVALLATILLYTWSVINFDYFIYAYTLILALPGIITIFYAFYKTDKIVWPSKELFVEKRQIGSYILFGVLSGSSYSLIQYADTLMLNKLTTENSESMVGIYSVMFFAALLINIPAKNMNRISAVVLAESWKNNDLDNIDDIYAKSANNLFIVGGYLFVIGWACIDPVLSYLPEYQIGKYAFFYLGLAKLIELATGANAEIIETSKKYRFNTYFNLILAGLVVGFNFVFITRYGVVGAAFASFLAMIIINIMRAYLLKSTYGLWPFKKLFYSILLVVTAFIIAVSFINYNIHPILKIVINFSVITLLYWGIMFKFKLAPEIRDWVNKMIHHFLKRGDSNS